jgi:hypothetical protein
LSYSTVSFVLGVAFIFPAEHFGNLKVAKSKQEVCGTVAPIAQDASSNT